VLSKSNAADHSVQAMNAATGGTGGGIGEPSATITGGMGGGIGEPSATITGGMGGGMGEPSATITGGMGGGIGEPSATITGGMGGGMGEPSATITGGTGGGIGVPSAMLTLSLKLTIALAGVTINAARAKIARHNLFLFTLEPPRLTMNGNKEVQHCRSKKFCLRNSAGPLWKHSHNSNKIAASFRISP
jgi:hypothetical protein